MSCAWSAPRMVLRKWSCLPPRIVLRLIVVADNLIIRHYNEGWAGGAHHGIRYWEIWNEPENRPSMWSGSDQDYFRLYRIAARAIKKHNPQLKVGGPAVGYSGELRSGTFR